MRACLRVCVRACERVFDDSDLRAHALAQAMGVCGGGTMQPMQP